MNHSIVVERFGIRLRPVTMDDADFIHQLRRSPELSRYIGEISPLASVHRSWLESYLQREDDYYFCIELMSGRPVGTISIYNIVGGRGNWGRWIITPSVPAAASSVLLIFHVAFHILGLSEVYSNTVVDNRSVVSFHESCGLVRTGIEPCGLTIRGVSYDMVIHSAKRDKWPSIQDKLKKPAALEERLLRDEME